MLCYRYLSRKWGLEALKTGKFKLSRVEETNDLFDCTGVFEGYFPDEVFKRIIYPQLTAGGKRELLRLKQSGDKATYQFVVRGLIDEWRMKLNFETFSLRRPICDDLLLLCMSEARMENDAQQQLSGSLMWAHYGDKGFGIRIGIEMPHPDQRNIVRVRYANKVPSVDWRSLSAKWSKEDGESFNQSFIDRRVMTKSAAWAYEHEVRLVQHVKSEAIEKIGKHYFLPIAKKQIKQIDFGPRCFKSDYAFYQYVQKLRTSGYEQTKFFLARMNPNTYAYDYKSEEYIRRSMLYARCKHLRNATSNGLGPFYQWFGYDVVTPFGGAATRTIEDVLGDMFQDDFEQWYDGFHDMMRKNVEPLSYLRMIGILDHLSLSPEDRFILNSEIVPIGGGDDC